MQPGEPRSSPRSGSAARLAGALALLLALAGCTSLDARVWNLRELHASDAGRPGVRVHRRRAKTVGVIEWYVRRLTTIGGKDIGVQKKDDETIEDPYGDCLKNLIRLARFGQSGRSGAAQVQFFTWLAAEDDYALSRERAALELGRHARRLGLVERPLPRGDAPPAPTPGELADVLAGLVGAFDRGGEGGRRAALQRETDVVRALELDLASGRRVLAVAGVLLDRSGRSNPDVAPLRDLELEVGRDCVEWALAAALADPHPRVRAAALRSCAVLGDAARDEVWLAALRDSAELVRREVLQLVEEQGLPAVDAERREQWLAAMIEATADLEGSVEVAACEALGAVAEAGFRSRRSEDWWAWWDERGGARAEAPGALREPGR